MRGVVVNQNDDSDDGAYLYIGEDYPSANRLQVFIPASAFRLWDYYPDYYEEDVVVYGVIRLNGGIPEIVVGSPDDIIYINESMY